MTCGFAEAIPDIPSTSRPKSSRTIRWVPRLPLHFLKAFRFDPDREAIEVLPLQFLMVLRDIRFFIPDEYRWTTAPVIGRFMVDTLGGMPTGIRPYGRHGSAHGDKLDEERIYGHLTRLLEREATVEDQQVVLRRAVADALKIGNGSFHAGLKLNPRKLNA